MDAQTVIDSYVNDVAAHLPRGQRNDIGFELRTLLTEELKAAADEAGRQPDEQLAMAVVQDFGQPEVVAAHYSPRGFALIEHEHALTFVMLATTIVAVDWLVTLPRVFLSTMTFREWAAGPGLGAMSWVGLLLVWFGVASWVRRRSPVDPQTLARPWTHWLFWLPIARPWRPVDHAANVRRLATRLIPPGTVATLFFIAPSWWLHLLLPAGAATSWAAYDQSFRHWILPPLLALMIIRLLMLMTVVINVRLWVRIEGFRVALWSCFIVLLIWVLFGWQIFANGVTNALFKTWLTVFVLINTIQLIAWMRKDALRVRTPGALSAQKNNPAG
jgi:hypothetical protein